MISLSETFQDLYHPDRNYQADRPRPPCCRQGDELVWFQAGCRFGGPVNPGWAININQGGDPAFENIKYCPWCGLKLLEVG